MTEIEKQEIEQLPEKYQPMTRGEYWENRWWFSMPIIGWIIMIKQSLVGKNINLKNYARCRGLLTTVAIIIAIIIISVTE